jgi:hypothetical protein
MQKLEAKEHFITQRRKILNNARLMDVIKKWEKGDIDGIRAQQQAHELNGMALGSNKNPIFTMMVEREITPDRIFYEDEDLLIIPNRASHQRSKDGASAAMSYVHFIIIPKKRIYNAVTLQPKHIELLNTIGDRAAEVLMEDDVKEYYLSQRDFDLSADHVIDPDYLELFVQVHPHANTAHMVVHACLKNLWTSNGEELAHKCLSLPQAVEVLKEQHNAGWMGVAEFRALRTEFRNSNHYEVIKKYERLEYTGADAMEQLHEGAKELPFKRLIDEKNGLDVGLFTHFVENAPVAPRPARIFYEDEDMMIIPNTRGASTKEEGRHAAISYIHYICLPKKRIFNAVTLAKEHIPLLQKMVMQSKRVYRDMDFRRYLQEQQGLFLSDEILRHEHLQFLVHPYPMNSMGHLAIHVCASNLWTENHNRIADRNLSLKYVIEALKAEDDVTLDAGNFTKMQVAFGCKQELMMAAKDWEHGRITGIEADELAGDLVGMHIPPLKINQPLFTHFAEQTKKPQPTIFYEDHEMLIFPNIKGHQRSNDGMAAAMSYVHMILIPRERIYNAVTLRREHIPLLLRMCDQARALIQRTEVREYYLEQRDLDLSPEILDPQYLDFFVHCHPTHSIGHLHIHACLKNLWTNNGSHLASKNMPLQEVILALDNDSGMEEPAPFRRVRSLEGSTLLVPNDIITSIAKRKHENSLKHTPDASSPPRGPPRKTPSTTVGGSKTKETQFCRSNTVSF